jgi:hypothetical protein
MIGALIATSAALLVFIFGCAIAYSGARAPSRWALMASSMMICLAIIGLGFLLDALLSWIWR